MTAEDGNSFGLVVVIMDGICDFERVGDFVEAILEPGKHLAFINASKDKDSWFGLYPVCLF